MPSTVIDLDEFLAPDKKVRLRKNGKVYTLPGDLDAELYLKITSASERGLSEAEFIRGLYDDVLALFRYGDPKLDKLPLALPQLINLIGAVYGNDEGQGDRRPPRTAARRSGGRSSRSRSATR